MSPFFIAVIAASRDRADAITGKGDVVPQMLRQRRRDGLSESLALRCFGRPKYESSITLPPFAAISATVGAGRSTTGISFADATLRPGRNLLRNCHFVTSSATPDPSHFESWVRLGDIPSKEKRRFSAADGCTPEAWE